MFQVIHSKITKMADSPSALNILYIPALLMFAIFIFLPFLQGIVISFMEWDGYSANQIWVGINKYITVFTDSNFYTTVKNTFIYGVGSTLFQNIFGLMFALLLDRNTMGEKAVRTLVYLPAIISGLIMGYIWYFFFSYDGGAINDILSLFGKEQIDWLASGSRSVWIITGVNTFQYLGISMIMYLAGLQNIPRDYYEAADIDGASYLSKFNNITIPLLMPAITVSVVTNLIGGLKLFDVIAALTGGGPGYESASISTMVYQMYFVRQDAGYAAAQGNIMFIIIAVISIWALKFLRSKEVEI
ncbi:MAG: sugar ABC transporter permease [Clostridia bacterium]|nr:sugar ABC transporter permease [Clostridia bacterium]